MASKPPKLSKCLECFIENTMAISVQKGLSQRALAQRSGMSSVYLNRLLKGHFENPGVAHLGAIAVALNVPLPQLLSAPGEGVGDHNLQECVRRVCEKMEETIPGFGGKKT